MSGRYIWSLVYEEVVAGIHRYKPLRAKITGKSRASMGQ